MAVEESNGKDTNFSRKAPPKCLDGFDSAFPPGKSYKPSLPEEKDRLLEQISGKRTVENTPSILPRLPGDAHYFLDRIGVTFYGLENRMGIRLALQIQQALNTKASEKGRPASDDPDKYDNAPREPYFPKSLGEIGDAITLLTKPNTEIPAKIDTKLTEEPMLAEKDYPIYRARLSPIEYIREHDEDGNPTDRAIVDEGVRIAIFPQTLRTYSPDGRIKHNLTGARPDEVGNMLSLRGRDPGEIQAIVDSYKIQYPYLALENREWEYRVTLQEGTMVSTLRNKNNGTIETLVSTFGDVCLSEPPKTVEQCEDRFTCLCREIINHFDARKTEVKKDPPVSSK